MILSPYIGQALLLGSLAASLLFLMVPRWDKPQKYLYALQPLLLIMAFGWLINAHLSSDFSLLNVVQHSHTQKPWLYKFAGTWGNHEGSMLLWTVMLACVGGIAFRNNNRALTLFSVMNFGFVLFLVMTCDPFAAILEIPQEGNDLNPLLQDPLLAIHPPFLYFGYICTAVLFTCAILKTKDIEYWRRWALVSWTSLTIGLGLGSFWAYYELGWGGWWFWDPVENVALIPWLLLTALLHTLLLGQWHLTPLTTARWLSYFSFASCLGGTFIVRSGLLTSVHSFAISPERGLFLGILIMFILIPGGWMLWREEDMDLKDNSTQTSSFLSIPTLMTLGVLFLILGAVIVTFGTIYPVILEAFNQSITVGAPYFKATFIPIMLPILGFMAMQIWLKKEESLPQSSSRKLDESKPCLGTNLTIRDPEKNNDLFVLDPGSQETLNSPSSLRVSRVRDDVHESDTLSSVPSLRVARIQDDKKGGHFPPAQILSSLLLSTLITLILTSTNLLPLSLNLIPLILGLWLFLSMVHFTVHKIRTKTFPLKKIAMITSHTGLGITILGMVLTTMLEKENLVALKEGESTQLAGRTLTLAQMEPHKGPNYMAQRAILKDESGNQLEPEKRFYWTQGIIHNETAIQSGLFDHLYIALGERYDNDSWSLRLYHKPWINLIWGGIAIMALGGLLGIYRRRLSLVLLLGSIIFSPQLQALEVHEQLPLKALELRAKAIGDKLICPTCVGQSLNDSAADEAQLLREIIRQQILKGQSDQQIIEWFVGRYGDRVLLAPPLSPLTYLLWAFPWILLALGGGVYWRRRGNK